ncbi:MAG: putative HxlR-family transcriptional regulator [Frankiales bacterium]|nr:putative HxlR-family transcriptional regulator [Frankiales bacterium]
METYGQFCPVSKAAELLDQRWTLLLMRELLAGSRHFNEIRRGLPRISPTLLSKRLKSIERAGLVTRVEREGVIAYELTAAGEELRPIVVALGVWGTRWIPELGDEALDPHMLLWDMHRSVCHDQLPAGRTVVHFAFHDAKPEVRHWWLAMSPTDADVCDYDPGFGDDLLVSGELRALTRVWRGDAEWPEVLRAGQLVVDGPSQLRSALPSWFTRSPFAAVPRPVAAKTPGDS